MTGHFLTAREAAAHLKLSKSLLDKLRLTGGGPAYMKLGSRRVVYDIDDLNAWAARGRREELSAGLNDVGGKQ
jgi:predicted DNA-binding transcriptional regulator AlpA